MKFKILMVCLLAAMFSNLSAQEATDLKLLTFKKDTTYQFCEIRTKDGDTLSVNFFPQTRLKKSAFVDFAYAMAQRYTEAKLEQERLAKMAQKNINFFSAQVDSVGGAGKYAELANGQLKTKMQGAWSLVVRSGTTAEPEIMTAVIQGDDFSTKDKKSLIEWTNGTRFKLKSGGVFAFTLTFDQVEPDRFTAERTDAQGKVTKYVLKR